MDKMLQMLAVPGMQNSIEENKGQIETGQNGL